MAKGKGRGKSKRERKLIRRAYKVMKESRDLTRALMVMTEHPTVIAALVDVFRENKRKEQETEGEGKKGREGQGAADVYQTAHQVHHQAREVGAELHHQASHQARHQDHQAQRVPSADLPLGVPHGRELEARPGADPHHHRHGTGGELTEQPDHRQTADQRGESEGQGQVEGRGEEEGDSVGELCDSNGETQIDSIHTVSNETLISLFSLESPHLEPQIRDSLMSHLSSPSCDSVLNAYATLHYARMVFRKEPLTVN